jgi:hypothetical protein
MSPPLPRDATLTTADRVSGTATSSGSTTSSTFGTSKIVRTAVAAGVIVLGLTALVLFFKVGLGYRASSARKGVDSRARQLLSRQLGRHPAWRTLRTAHRTSHITYHMPLVLKSASTTSSPLTPAAMTVTGPSRQIAPLPR